MGKSIESQTSEDSANRQKMMAIIKKTTTKKGSHLPLLSM